MADLATTLRNTDPNNGFDPYSGQVQLQKFDQSQIDPETGGYASTNVNYTIPKESIKQFIPDVDESGSSLGSGQYVLNDGSTMRVSGEGVVQSATPARNEYTLNAQGYYQPTGSNLTWRGDQNTLTKNIGGVEVQVPNIYHKGGYQNAQGNIAVDANGVPVALAPNYLDSGFGESGLSDAAPYITALTLAAFGMPVGAMAFEGIVPASETVMGSLGSGATASGGFGLNASQVPNLGASLGATGGTTAGTGATGFGITAPSAGYTFGGINAGALGTGVPASLAMPTTGALAGGTTGASSGLTGMQKAMLIRSGMNALNQMTGGSDAGGTSGGGGSGNYNYASMPFLANPQQNQTFMKTGSDVSGSGITTAGMPVQLDTTRHNLLMANLLRG